MIPIVAGLLMGAAMGGGIAALQKKNVLEGALMGAVGGAAGSVLMPGAAAVAAPAESSLAGSLFGEAGSQSITPAFNAGIANPLLVESGRIVCRAIRSASVAPRGNLHVNGRHVYV